MLGDHLAGLESDVFADDVAVPQGKFRVRLLLHYRGRTRPEQEGRFRCQGTVHLIRFGRKDEIFFIFGHTVLMTG